MFLHITTRIPGRKDDGLLRTVGGRGFPTLVGMSATGEVLTKPRNRRLAGLRNAMEEAAELEAEDRSDAENSTPKILRKLATGSWTDSTADRALYLSERQKLSKPQRREVEQALILAELTQAQIAGMQAKLGSLDAERAMLQMLAAKTKNGGAWPKSGITNRVLITLMRMAEHKGDPLLFAALFRDFEKVRRTLYTRQRNNEQFIAGYQARLDALWAGKKPQRSTPGGAGRSGDGNGGGSRGGRGGRGGERRRR